MTAVSVALLVVADCPHEAQAAALVRRALDEVGLAATGFETRIIRDRSDAKQADFVGSPTILINGADPFVHPASNLGWPAGSIAAAPARQLSPNSGCCGRHYSAQ